MTVQLLPDAEKFASQFLRSRTEITSLVGQRVYTAIPDTPSWPLLLVRRVSGAPVLSQPLYIDRATLQLDAYGGTKRDANVLIETARAVLAQAIGNHGALGVVSDVSFGPMSWLPDDDYPTAKPRFVADVNLVLHP